MSVNKQYISKVFVLIKSEQECELRDDTAAVEGKNIQLGLILEEN